MFYKKFLKRFGILFASYAFWSIIFYYFADRTQKIWSDLGVLEAFAYLVAATIGGYLQFFLCLIIFFCFFYLRKIKKIKLDNFVLFLLGLFVNLIISLSLILFIVSKLVMKLDIESISLAIFIPFIHSLLSFYIISGFMNKFIK
jgi:hypothetical protein